MKNEGGSGNRGGRTSSKKILTFVVSGLVCWALFGFAQPVKAEGPRSSDDSYSALVDFVQRIGTEKPELVAAAEQPRSSDDSYSALVDFVQRIGAEEPGLVAAAEQPKSGDDSYSALVDFVQRIGAEKPKLVAAAEKPKPGVAANVGADGATYVGAQVCATCHAVQAEDFGKTLMGRIGKSQPGKMECESCHGPGSAHVAAGGGRGVGGINGFNPKTPEKVAENNAICLSCHEKGNRTYWRGSNHETRGLACTSCHTVMKAVSAKRQLKTEVEAETCFQCHKLQRMQMQRSSHMPVREGKMTCTDCHNPHGSATDKLLREASVNDTCYKCHADRRGPFLWEHAPVREDCLNCHLPHGSNNEYLLKVARPRLCNECHTTVHSPSATGGFGLPNTVYTLGRACGNCHNQIHGSNHPGGRFFQR